MTHGCAKPTGTATISLAMIVRDEAPRLPGCLGPLAGAVDDIVVVDTGSTDGTPAVARAHGARVIEWAWRDDFAAARNESLRHCMGQWVLILDADERLGATAAALLRDLIGTGGADGYDCRLVSALPPGQPSPTIASWYCRLFRRHPGVRFEGRVHEQVAPSIRAAGGRIVRSGLVIEHAGYALPSPAKVARNLRLLRLDLAERPDHPFTLFHLGLTLHAAGDAPGAAAALERALAAGLAGTPRAMAWSTLAEGHLQARRWPDAADAARRALEEDGSLVLARHALARALFEMGDHDGAAGIFGALGEATPDALGAVLHRRLAILGLGLCHLRRRRWAEAAAALEPALADDDTGEIALHLGTAYLGLRRAADAERCFRRARALGWPDPDLGRRLDLCARLATLPA